MIKPLITTIIAALIGAIAGGIFTYYIVLKNTQTRAVMDAYNLYIPEAYRAWSLVREGEFTEAAKARLVGASAVLMIYASNEVICRANAFDTEIRKANFDAKNGHDSYFDLLLTMRREIIGKDHIGGLGISKTECIHPVL